MKSHILTILFTVFFACSICAETIPALINPQDYDSEYELDIFQTYWTSEALWEWLSSESGFRITGGSLNIRHTYHDRDLKLRLPIVHDKLWLRYRHSTRQVIEDEWQVNEIELEYALLKKWFFSVIGDPVYHKSDIDVGCALRYGVREDAGIKLSYMLIDYDANYAYSNKSVNEGFERFYRDFPYEWRLQIIYAAELFKIWIEGSKQSNWTREEYDLLSPLNNTIITGREYMLEGEITYIMDSIVPSLYYFGRFTRKGQMTMGLGSYPDHLRWEKRLLARPSVRFLLSERMGIETGITITDHTGEDFYPNSTNKYRNFNNRNIIPYVIARNHITGPVYVETGYMHGTIDEQKIEGFLSYRDIKRENRLRFAIDMVFSTGARIKLITGWDLDREDWGKFAIFDGGNAQLQIPF